MTTHDKFESYLWLMVKPAEVKGQWIAHCLDLDLVTQGDSIEHAFKMAAEAILMTVCDDLAAGRDPLQRKAKTPPECWEEWSRVLKTGLRVQKISDLERRPIAAIAAQVHVVAFADQRPKVDKMEKTTPAWLIESMGGPGMAASGQPHL